MLAPQEYCCCQTSLQDRLISNLLVQMGKEGTIYLVDRNKMGGYCSSCVDIDTQIVQEINNASVGVWGSPAYWNGNVYWVASNDQGTASNLLAFSFNAGNSGLLSTAPTSQSNSSLWIRDRNTRRIRERQQRWNRLVA